MTLSESQMQKSIHGLPVPTALAEEIERALEMMQRVRTAELAQGKGKVVYPPGNRYEIPEPVVYPVSRSTGERGNCGNTYVLPKPLVYPVSPSSGERGASAP